MVRDYLHDQEQNPHQSRLLLATTRLDCHNLNQAIHQALLEKGDISHEVTLSEKGYAVGEKIIFLRNDRGKAIRAFNPHTGKEQDFMVRNGTTGKIVSVVDEQLTVAVADDLHVQFSYEDYPHIDYGYALTLHKAQGQTVDRVFVLAGKSMDAYATYVALTRHREDVTLYYRTTDFADFAKLQQTLGRIRDKDLVVDYSISAENLEAWEVVQDYVALGIDMVATRTQGEWTHYRSLHLERQSLGKIILNNWDTYSDYVRQAGLTYESIEIQAGLKTRPLSSLEQTAADLGKAYQEKAQEARNLWNSICSTHSWTHAKSHPDYKRFD